MGTSQSSAGPGAGVSLVPAWAEEVFEEGGDREQPDGVDPVDGSPVHPVPVAPPRRFLATRSHLGKFAKFGNGGHLKSGVGHYISTGYGGSKTFSRRLAGTATAAYSLARVLDPTEVGTDLDRALLATSSVDQIMDSVVEASRPHDGTQDAESGREAVREALTELLTRFPDADLLDLTELQREFAVEKFVVNDVFRRFELDVGNQILAKAPSAAMGAKRMQEAKNYISAVVSGAFRKLAERGMDLTPRTARKTVMAALRESCKIFEEYIQ